MKKFLFTLAALFTFAGIQAQDQVCQFYVENFYGQKGAIEVPVYMHLEGAAISAFSVDIQMPEGIIIDGDAEALEGMTLEYYNNRGTLKTVSPTLNQNPDVDGDQRHGRYIVANSQGGYYNVDGTWTQYGSVKWLPAEEDYEMFMLYLVVDDSFETGAITFAVQPSCGADARPEVTTWTRGYVPEPTVVNIAPDQPQEVVAPEPTLNWDENELVMEATCANHEVVLMVNGVEVTNNPYLVEQTTEEQTIVFSAYTKPNADLGETTQSATVEQTVVVPAKDKTPSAKPGFAFDLGEDVATITVTGNNISGITVNGTDNYTIEGNVVTIPRPAYNEDAIVVTVTATNTDQGWVTPTTATSDEYTVAPKGEKVYQTATPVVTVTPGEDAYTLTATCEDEGQVVLVVQYINEDGSMETVRYENGTVTIDRTDADQAINYWAEATANTPAGYDSVAPASSTAVYYYIIPAKEVVTPEQTAKPVITYVVDEVNQKVIVTATGNGTVILYNDDVEVARGEGKAVYEVPFTADPEGEEMGFSATAQENGKDVSEYALATIEIPGKANETTAAPSIHATSGDKCYVVTVENNAADPNAVIFVSIDGAPYEVYTGAITIADMGDHTVHAYAVADGKNPSNVVNVGFTVDENTKPDPSAVNELNGEKAVAGVRYFNMAGQEMQEANGMTIVVTTYTDGTTSAVKVMK